MDIQGVSNNPLQPSFPEKGKAHFDEMELPATGISPTEHPLAEADPQTRRTLEERLPQAPEHLQFLVNLILRRGL